MNKILFYKTFYQNFQTFNNYNFSYKENKIVDNQLLDISTKEFEAETTAYLVCCSLGMFDNLEYSREKGTRLLFYDIILVVER